MNYLVKLRQIIVKEFVATISDELAKTSIDAMELAESCMEGVLSCEEFATETEGEWVAVSVKEEQ